MDLYNTIELETNNKLIILLTRETKNEKPTYCFVLSRSHKTVAIWCICINHVVVATEMEFHPKMGLWEIPFQFNEKRTGCREMERW